MPWGHFGPWALPMMTYTFDHQTFEPYQLHATDVRGLPCLGAACNQLHRLKPRAESWLRMRGRGSVMAGEFQLINWKWRPSLVGYIGQFHLEVMVAELLG